MENLDKEIKELQDELFILVQEKKNTEKSIRKGMNNEQYKKLQLLIKQIEKDIDEVTTEIQVLIDAKEKGIDLDLEDGYFGDVDENYQGEGEGEEEGEENGAETEEEEVEEKIKEEELEEVDNEDLQKRVDEILGYSTAHINQFLNDRLNTALQEDWTFESGGKGYSIQPIVNTDENGDKIISVIFAIYRDESVEVGQIVYNPSSGFLANSKHFQWSELIININSETEVQEIEKEEVVEEPAKKEIEEAEEVIPKEEDEVLPQNEENKEEEIKNNQ